MNLDSIRRDTCLTVKEVEEAHSGEIRRAGQVRELRGGRLPERSNQRRPCRAHLLSVRRRHRAGALVSVGELRNHGRRRVRWLCYHEMDVPVLLQLHLNDLDRDGKHR